MRANYDIVYTRVRESNISHRERLKTNQHILVGSMWAMEGDFFSLL